MDLVQASSLAVLAALVFLGYRRYQDLLYPPVLAAGIWLAVLGAFVVDQDSFVRVSPAAYLIIVSGAVLFTVGGYFGSLSRDGAAARRPAPLRRDLVSEILFWLPIVLLPLAVIRLRELGEDGYSHSILVNARYQLTKDSGAMGPVSYLAPLSIANLAFEVFQWEARDAKASIRQGLRLALAVLTAGVHAFLSTGRTFFFLIGATAAGVILLRRRVSTKSALALFFVLGLACFALMAFLMDKGGAVDGDVEQSAIGLAGEFRLYLLGAIPALDIHVHAYKAPIGFSHVFRSLFAVSSSLGYVSPADVVPLVQDYVPIPAPHNVFTVYQPYYDDFGLGGALTAQLVFGAWHGFLYRKAREKRPIFVFLFSIFLYPLVMQFFQDQYMSLLSMWAQLFAYGWLLFMRPIVVPSSVETHAPAPNEARCHASTSSL